MNLMESDFFQLFVNTLNDVRCYLSRLVKFSKRIIVNPIFTRDMRIPLIILLSMLVLSVQAQKRKKKSSSAATSQVGDQPSSLNPSTSEKKYGPKKSKKG